MEVYTPSGWVILKIPKYNQFMYKIVVSFASPEDSRCKCKVNGGITSVNEYRDKYRLFAYTGTQYDCPKKSEGCLCKKAILLLKDILSREPQIQVISFKQFKQDFCI